MTISSYEIRVCPSCGLRYPLVEGHAFGTRCPSCLGDTRLVLRRELPREPARTGIEQEEKKGSGIAVLLDNVRSAQNVGSILRSADGFGFTHAYLCGITPTADHEAVLKTSLGAEESVPWSYHKDAVRLVKGLKAEGWRVFGLEDDPRAVELSHAALSASRRGRFAGGVTHDSQLKVLILGNEVTGIDPELLNLCDQIFYIPMRGEKKSFNVAIAFGIAAYALRAINEERLS